MALSKVTDEFIAHIKAMGAEWDLGQATEFLVVAATLLDLKAARLLPSGEVEDEEDLALLEARDLLFARLLQYRAYKQVGRGLRAVGWPGGGPVPASGHPGAAVRRAAARGAARPRAAGVRRAGRRGRCTPGRSPTISLDHLHAPRVSVREQAAHPGDRAAPVAHGDVPGADRRLRGDASSSWPASSRCSSSTARAPSPSSRSTPLGELHMRWIGSDEGEIEVPDEFDDAVALAAVRNEDDAGTADVSDGASSQGRHNHRPAGDGTDD